MNLKIAWKACWICYRVTFIMPQIFRWDDIMTQRSSFARVLSQLTCLIGALLIVLATSHSAVAAPDKTTVIPIRTTASFSVLADICAQIGGDWMQVQTLVDWDQDSHMFTPQPAHLKMLQDSELLVSSGLGLESWLPRMLRTINYRGQQFIAGAHVQTIHADVAHDHGEHDHHEAHHDHDDHESHDSPTGVAGLVDPHWWDSLHEMRRVVAALVPVLESLRPQAGSYFRDRAERYQARLDVLQQEAQTLLSRIPASQRYLIVPHNAFAYLARDYGLQTRSLQGLSTAEQANSKDMVALVKLIREAGVPAIFTETTSDARLIKQIQQETGVRMGGALISGALSRTLAPDYLAMMQHNIKMIAAGLGAK